MRRPPDRKLLVALALVVAAASAALSRPAAAPQHASAGALAKFLGRP
jgi:hypothetical protein